MKGRVKERWSELTDDELDRVHGEREQLVGLITWRYGIARAKAEKQADKFARAVSESAD